MSKKTKYIISKKCSALFDNAKAKFLGNLIWRNSPDTLLYCPIIDFSIIPNNFDLKKLTTSKVSHLMVEVGTGNGDFLAYIDKKETRAMIIGFEIVKEYYLKTKNKITRNLYTNAKISHSEAFKTIQNKFQDNSITKLYINFPDPWPKKKHQKRRFLTEDKLPEILNKIKNKGEIIFVTDHINYAQEVEIICQKFIESKKINIKTTNNIPQDYPQTKYYKKWIGQNKTEFRTIIITKIS